MKMNGMDQRSVGKGQYNLDETERRTFFVLARPGYGETGEWRIVPGDPLVGNTEKSEVSEGTEILIGAHRHP